MVSSNSVQFSYLRQQRLAIFLVANSCADLQRFRFTRGLAFGFHRSSTRSRHCGRCGVAGAAGRFVALVATYALSAMIRNRAARDLAIIFFAQTRHHGLVGEVRELADQSRHDIGFALTP